MLYKFKLECSYTIEAPETSDPDDLINLLANKFENENISVENEFWDNLEVVALKQTKPINKDSFKNIKIN